jgi:ubiquinone/menaquinone biosynthesis C-methylase UbiE
MRLASARNLPFPMTSPAQHPNVDLRTIDGFGLQWRDFDQAHSASGDLDQAFGKYFEGFPWSGIDQRSIGLDAGCGSGRWAKFVAPKVGKLICVDASAGAAKVAQANLESFDNCSVQVCTLEEIPIADNTLDFAYCLGVLHYIPDPGSALSAIVRKLKPGAPLLLYVYYALDNRSMWFRCIFRGVDLVRRAIAKMPYTIRRALSDVIAASVYLPLARLSRFLESKGFDVTGIPLSAYRHRSFYTMRTDCLDRFGNHLEHRFTRQQLHALLEEAGMTNIVIPTDEPYWRALAEKK